MSYPEDFPIPEELIPIILRKLLSEPEQNLLERYRAGLERDTGKDERTPVTSTFPFTPALPSTPASVPTSDRGDSPMLPTTESKQRLAACIIRGFLRRAQGQKTLILGCDTRIAALETQLTYRHKIGQTDLDLIIRRIDDVEGQREGHLKLLSHLVNLSLAQIASRDGVLDVQNDNGSRSGEFEHRTLMAFEAQCREYADWTCRQGVNSHRRRSRASLASPQFRSAARPARSLAEELQDVTSGQDFEEGEANESESEVVAHRTAEVRPEVGNGEEVEEGRLAGEDDELTENRRSTLYPAEYWYGVTTDYTGARTDSCCSETP